MTSEYKKLYKYPHMKPRDIAIWERHLEKYPDAYDGVLYDLNVGEGAKIPKETPENVAKSYTVLTQRKIDVVGYKAGRVDIIEVKPEASASTIGQVLGYIELYKNYVDPESDPTPVIVTDTLMPDMPLLCARQGVRLVIV